MNSDPRKKFVLVIAGPTASGKSGLAMHIAEELDGEIVNADSMQIYKEFPVLTARPSSEDEDRVPHHLYGCLPSNAPCSAGNWLEMAVPVIRDILARGKLPIVCGGTGLYLKVLREGIAPVPDIPRETVAKLSEHYRRIGGDAFKEELAKTDPVGASKLEAGDRQRLIRAYCVVEETGQTLDDWHAKQTPAPPLEERIFTVHLIPPREALYEMINSRFEKMIDMGALEEVEEAVGQNPDPDLPALKALGVPDFKNYLSGRVSLDEAVEKSKQRTRNFAKRQLTWFRNQSEADLSISGFGDTHACKQVIDTVMTINR